MRIARLAGAATVCLLFAAGCAFPGSKVGELSVKGRLSTEDGEPLPGRTVEFLLPAEYGLGPMDLALGGPEAFGHEDVAITVTTDANGEFNQIVRPSVYHINFWVLPPLGARPEHPPSPMLALRVPSYPGEFYIVWTGYDDYVAYDANGEELPEGDAALRSLATRTEPYMGEELAGTATTVELVYPAP